MQRQTFIRFAVVIAVLAAGALGARSLSAKPNEGPATVVRAQRFELLSAEGEVIARIQALPEKWPGIEITGGKSSQTSFSLMFVGDEAVTMQLSCGPGKASVHVDSTGRAGIELGGNEPGSCITLLRESAKSPTILLRKPDGSETSLPE